MAVEQAGRKAPPLIETSSEEHSRAELNSILCHIKLTDSALLPLLSEISLLSSEEGFHPLLLYELTGRVGADLTIRGVLPPESPQIMQKASLLHDVGKVLISSASVQESVEVMNWVPKNGGRALLPFEPQSDLREGGIRIIQRLHPRLSGLAASPFLDADPGLSKDNARAVMEIIRSHHENRTNGAIITGRGNPLDSYPRKLYRPTGENIALTRLVFELADTSLAMAEPRGYRGYVSLPEPVIAGELYAHMPESRLERYRSGSMSAAQIRHLVCRSVLRHLKDLAPTIGDMHEVNPGELNWGYPLPKEGDFPLLERMHRRIWMQVGKSLPE